MRILVTGSSGFIGSHLVDRLISEHEVWGIDRRAGKHTQIVKDCRTLYGSASYGIRPDFIYHLASTVGVSKVLNDPAGCIENIVESTKAVLSMATPGIYFSTSEVYGQNTEPLREDSAIMLSSKPRWSYAAAKLCGEWMALQAGWKVVRLFNVIGPRQSQESGAVVPTFVRQALAGEPITVYGDGKQVRTFIDVLDCVEILDRLRDKTFDILNIGGENHGTINGLAWIINDVLHNHDAGIRHIPYSEAYPLGFEECVHRVPTLSKLEALFPNFICRSFTETILSVAKELQCTATSNPLPHPAKDHSSPTPPLTAA